LSYVDSLSTKLNSDVDELGVTNDDVDRPASWTTVAAGATVAVDDDFLRLRRRALGNDM
jgi:uncharacterized protein YfiM (DUF2279 family)